VHDIQSRNHSSSLIFTTITNNSTLLRALSLLLVEVQRLSRDKGGRRGEEKEEEGSGEGSFSVLSSFSSLFPGLGALRVGLKVGGWG
jgi:hypothetical protein